MPQHLALPQLKLGTPEIHPPPPHFTLKICPPIPKNRGEFRWGGISRVPNFTRVELERISPLSPCCPKLSVLFYEDLF